MPGRDHFHGGGLTMKKPWYDYLWIAEIVYFMLGLFNILFAWLGLVNMMLPLGIALFGGHKFYCNHICGRSQLFTLLGGRFGLSRRKAPPRFLYSKAFRWSFLIRLIPMSEYQRP